MAGYTRQSVAQIVDGLEITADPLNREFNALATALGQTGHSHDGTEGNGPKIDLTTSVDGYLPIDNGGINGKHNLTAIDPPTQFDDNVLGYSVGSLWVDLATQKAYLCVSDIANAALWTELVKVENGTVTTVGIDDTEIGGTTPAAGTFTNLNATTVNLDGGVIDNTTIGASTPTTIRGTIVTATDKFVGALEGNVTGDVTGDVSGNITGNLIGSDGSTDYNHTTGTFYGTLSGDSNGTHTGAVNAANNKLTNLAEPTENPDAATKYYVDASISQGTNSVFAFREDARKYAINPEDSQYTTSTQVTGYSALHYAAKADASATASEASRQAAVTAQGIAENAKTIAVQKAATISNALDAIETRLIGVMI